ncbi:MULTISPECIES: hypothetical protein [unclassified Streptomyces]|uniref:hypothetical protein n=1 Tax=unclassified Streptomyces TaxID=2593676 RepID=UPI0009403BD6|nr:hypothetical protein [Streptomyces sp. CB02058]OKI97856.1 hypothetical protein AMK10_03265 [Streptomyces sp. CB02058]
MALLSAFALVSGLLATALAVLAPSAQAVQGGALTVTPTSGDLDTKPVFTGGEFTGTCPDAYRPDDGKAPTVKINLEQPDGKLTSLRTGLTSVTESGGKSAFTMSGLTYTLRSRLSAEQPQGRYAIVVSCTKNNGDLFGQGYRVPIDVTADGWSVAGPGAATDLQVVSEGVAVAESDQLNVRTTVTVSPAGAAGTVTLQVGPVAAAGGVGADRIAVVGGKAEFVTETPYQPGTELLVQARFNPADRVAHEPSTTWSAYTVAKPAPSPTGTPTGTPSSTVTPTGTPTGEPTDDPTDEPTEPADLDVTDEEGNVLDAEPVLEAGQKVLITARGYAEDATVKATLSDSEAEFADATADAEGTVTGYEFTVPEDIADGDHTLTLAEEATDGHSVAFAFVTGEQENPTPDPSDTTGTDTAGTSGGTDAGTTGGGTGGSGGSGPAGGLASTGSRIAAIGLSSLALIGAGAACVIHVRRKGLLSFGSPAGH